ncbi:DUF397 domain-containing protein [Pseudonocardia sp. CNS-139]|nr:DUF397 domain-containing protein [Pseudonocardia sp. CNS-139]
MKGIGWVDELLACAPWRKSSFSGGGDDNGGACVEVASLPDGRVAVRDSKHPEQAALLLPRTAMTAWVAAVKAGEFDTPAS